jgi:hypothetical protein
MTTVATLVVALVLWPASARAQSPTATSYGTIRGSVTDPYHSPIAGVTVVLGRASARAASRALRTAKTDERGDYAIAHLHPGVYSIDVAAAGFLPRHGEPIVLTAGSTAIHNVVLGNVCDEQVACDGALARSERRRIARDAISHLRAEHGARLAVVVSDDIDTEWREALGRLGGVYDAAGFAALTRKNDVIDMVVITGVKESRCCVAIYQYRHHYRKPVRGPETEAPIHLLREPPWPVEYVKRRGRWISSYVFHAEIMHAAQSN